MAEASVLVTEPLPPVALLTDTRLTNDVWATDKTDTWLERTERACESTLKEFDVGEALPPVPAEMRLDRALRIDWNPCVETLPTDRTDAPLMTALILFEVTSPADSALETMFERVLCAELRFETVAFVTESACDTTEAALLTTLIAEAACALTALTSFEVTEPPTIVLIRFDSAFRMLWTPRVETFPTDRAEAPLTTPETILDKVL